MSLVATIRLMYPAEGMERHAGGIHDASMESGGGFRTVEVVYEVNPIGSKSLYRLVSVTRKGVAVDLDQVLRLNADDGIDEAISAKFKDYASTVQQQQGGQGDQEEARPSKTR